MSAARMEQDVLESFARVSNPETNIFIERLRDMITIYNHTTDIYFDDKKIYLLAK